MGTARRLSVKVQNSFTSVFPSCSRSCTKSASPSGSNRPPPIRATGLYIVATPYMGGLTALDAVGDRQRSKKQGGCLTANR